MGYETTIITVKSDNVFERSLPIVFLQIGISDSPAREGKEEILAVSCVSCALMPPPFYFVSRLTVV